jgi:hypothetical protein
VNDKSSKRKHQTGGTGGMLEELEMVLLLKEKAESCKQKTNSFSL